jgi:thiamine pyrophosphate-dependent acetolactate synthase large subunit-like protein
LDGDTVIARILKSEGVEWIAGYPYQTLIDTAAKEGIRPIIPRQERTGVNMADGFSRINNGKRIGVFCMQLGPGAENAFGGVAQAFADSVPILLLPGGYERSVASIAPNFNSVDNYKGITKWAASINIVDRIPEFMRRAFSHLRNGRSGPVLLEIPKDLAVEEYPYKTFEYTPVSQNRSDADKDDVKELVTALLRASNPVINAGQGVLYAEASDKLVQLADMTGIPVLTTTAGKSAFPETHPLSLGTGSYTSTLAVAEFLKSTDFVFGIGTSFTPSNFNAPMPKGVTLAQSTNKAEDVNQTHSVQFGAVGDASLVLDQIIEEVKVQLNTNRASQMSEVVNKISKLRQTFYSEWTPLMTSDEVPINPYRVIADLIKCVDVSNTIITHDSGYPRDQLVPFWPSVTPRSYIGWGKSTQLGYGLGLAMGAKLADPEKTVINLMGDAAFGMAGMDIETAARSNIGITTIILNNSVMTGYSLHMPYASKKWGSHSFTGEYAKVAEGLGAYAEKVNTPDRIPLAIKNSLSANSDGKPAVIEIITKEETRIPKFW